MHSRRAGPTRPFGHVYSRRIMHLYHPLSIGKGAVGGDDLVDENLFGGKR
jgi:hypothetical protein